MRARGIGVARTTIAFLASLCLAAGCSAPRRSFLPNPGPYDRLSSEAIQAVRGARAAREAGDLAGAARRLQGLLAADPTKIGIGVQLQDVQLELLENGGELAGMVASDKPAPERLRVEYARRAEVDPTPASLVLAARLESDGPSALRLLDRALELDPSCVWGHYGRAHVLLARGAYQLAREALDRALDLDAGHLWARRLDVRALVEGGSVERAAAALERWIEDAAESPFVALDELRTARVDLAIQYSLIGEEQAALELLDELLEEDPGDVRVRVARSATLFARGRWADALRDIQAALVEEPDELLAAVQRALLIEAAGDRDEAAAAWEYVLATLDKRPVDPDSAMGELLVRTQARVRLQRLEREGARERERDSDPEVN